MPEKNGFVIEPTLKVKQKQNIKKHRPEGLFGGGDQERSEIFIPFKTSFKLRQYLWIGVLAESKSAEVSEDARAEITFFLRRTRNIKPGDPDNFEVQSLQNILEVFNKITFYVTMVAGGIVGISLLVGGVGIMNIMLVSVSERTREIGLRKAVDVIPDCFRLESSE